jgi:TolA-binding protein
MIFFRQLNKSNRIRTLLALCQTSVLVLLSLSAGGASKSSDSISDNPEHQAALSALANDLPEVAALKWERLLKSNTLSQVDTVKISERMVDALLRAGQGEKALLSTTLFKIPDSDFYKGQAFLVIGHFQDAISSFRNYQQPGAKFAAEAQLAYGQALIGQHREATARKEFKELLESSDPVIAQRAKLFWNESEIIAGRAGSVLKRLATDRLDDKEIEFIKACASLASADGREAEHILRRIIEDPAGTPDRLRDASLLRLVEAYRMQLRENTSERLLLKILDSDQPFHFYDQAFALLRRLKDEDGDLLRRMMDWAKKPLPKERQALALFHSAEVLKEQGRPLEAIAHIEEFRKLNPQHAREGEALRLAMQCYGAVKEDDRVLELANEWHSKFGSGNEGTVDYLTGMIRFSQKDFTAAMDLFERAAVASNDRLLHQRAIYNQAVSALLGGKKELFEHSFAQLKTESAAEVDNAASSVKQITVDDQGAKLLIERALFLAGKRDPSAEAVLLEFSKSYPQHPQRIKAHVALAELYLLSLPPRSKAAMTALDTARGLTEADDTWRERIDYTKLWLHEADADHAGTIAAGLDFLAKWPKSANRDDVRMKIAQAYYRQEDFPKAMVQFEALVEEQADSPFAEAAQFFAGKASMAQMNAKGLDHAIELWNEVAAHNGLLANEARRQQAIAERRNGRMMDALAVLESLLTSKKPPQGEEKLALLIEKGELLMLLAKEEPKNLDDAVALFQTVRQDAKSTRIWRSRAGVLLAQCFERMSKPEEALEACYDVVESHLANTTGAPTPAESVWLYRAGFAALDILERKKEWEAAAHLADRLANTSGDRAAEAKAYATRLRLEHFLWDK